MQKCLKNEEKSNIKILMHFITLKLLQIAKLHGKKDNIEEDRKVYTSKQIKAT